MTEQQQAQQQESQQQEQHQGGTSEKAPVAYHRFEDVNRRMQEAERKAAEMEAAQQQREEEAAQQQGEYQKLAETRKNKLETAENRIKALEAQIVRDERYRAFVGGSQGVILPEALDDAFEMITEEEFKSVQPGDEGGFRMLAQNLADRKPYLADGARGAGSRGSDKPVFLQGSRQEGGSGRKNMKFNSRKRHFK